MDWERFVISRLLIREVALRGSLELSKSPIRRHGPHLNYRCCDNNIQVIITILISNGFRVDQPVCVEILFTAEDGDSVNRISQKIGVAYSYTSEWVERLVGEKSPDGNVRSPATCSDEEYASVFLDIDYRLRLLVREITVGGNHWCL